MTTFTRTLIDSEKQARNQRTEIDRKHCSEEIYSSINHLTISFEKLIDELTTDTIEKHKEHIDNVYYHIGKIKGCN